MNRKDFLKSAVVFAAGGFSDLLEMPDSVDLPIVDTHQHLVDFSRFGKGWAKPPVEGNYGTREYLQAVEGLHVVKAVYMEVAVEPENRHKEALYALELCGDDATPTVGAVIAADIYSDQFKSYISQFKGNSCLKGIRVWFKSGESLTDPGIIRHVRYLGEIGLRLDFVVPPAWFPQMLRLIEACPDTWFQADHCVNGDPRAFFEYDPGLAKPAHSREEWLRGAEKIAARRNVVCKISGIVSCLPGLTPDARNLRPIVDMCYELFGPDRVMFAGDWPWCLKGTSLAGWVEILKEIVRDRPLVDQKKLFHDNAIRHYQL